MARVTYVKSAQQRYATVPVIDPATGEQKRTPVMGRDGEQKQSKRGPVFMSVTTNDLTQPLPNRKCERCSTEIEVGMPYKHVTPKSGPYGGRKRVRCAACPTWQVWDLSQSLSARTAEIEYNFEVALASACDTSEAEAARDEAAEAANGLAEEKRESAQNIEDGFGHPTSSSDELNEVADGLESWASDIESMEIPDAPDVEDLDCEECEGSGKREPGQDEDYDEDDLDADGQVVCDECEGSGHPTEVPEDELENWRGEFELPACEV